MRSRSEQEVAERAGAATCEEALQFLRDLARNPLAPKPAHLRQAILGFHSSVYQHK